MSPLPLHDALPISASQVLYQGFQIGLFTSARHDFGANMGVAQTLLSNQAAFTANQLINAVFGEKFVVYANILDLPDGVNALDIEGELRFVACAGVNHLDFINGD